MPYSYSAKKCGHLCGLLLLSLLLLSISLPAQIKWDGQAGDGQWSTAANWSNNTVPTITDNVLLDNSTITASYAISLPTASAVTISSLRISPGNATTIQLLLPPSNVITPAFTVMGGGYGLVLDDGGVFLNESGANSSAALVIHDSMRINNGGQYIHRTRCAHAAMVTILSRQPGTEKGIFTFDVPGGGYTIASANRRYGTLELSGLASGGVQAYASTAANLFTINGNLVIKDGVSMNLNISAPTIIKGDFIQEGGIFNISSQDNDNIVSIKGNCLQSAGVITETANGIPVLELNGIAQQDVQIASITNSVKVKVNNPAGIKLLSDASFPYQLVLADGTVNSSSFVVTLQSGCSLLADSLANSRFITGALKKEGLTNGDYFLFPIGKGNTKRWLAVKNSSGNFTAEFFKMNPKTISNGPVNGIDHTSSIEYWKLQADATVSPAANVELSFDNVNSGGVTDMTALRVAQLLAGSWTGAGNTSTTGSAGGAGSVISNYLQAFNTVDYFTLASSTALQNPLPVQLISFTGFGTGNGNTISWELPPSWKPAYFLLQSSASDNRYETVAKIDANDRLLYTFSDKRIIAGKQLYRLQMVDKDSTVTVSKAISVQSTPAKRTAVLWPSAVNNNARLLLEAEQSGEMQVNIYAINGKQVLTCKSNLVKGANSIPLSLGGLSSGMYVVIVTGTSKQLLSIPFMKLP